MVGNDSIFRRILKPRQELKTRMRAELGVQCCVALPGFTAELVAVSCID